MEGRERREKKGGETIVFEVYGDVLHKLGSFGVDRGEGEVELGDSGYFVALDLVEFFPFEVYSVVVMFEATGSEGDVDGFFV